MLIDLNADTNMDSNLMSIILREESMFRERNRLDKVRDGGTELADMNTESDVDFLSLRQEFDLKRHHEDYNSPLIEALSRRDSSLVRTLIEADARPGALEIVFAAEWGDRSIIQDLINSGADVNAIGVRNNHIVSALIISIKKRDQDLAKFLVHAGANPNIPNIETKDYFTEDDGSIPLVKENSPLAAAAKNGDVGMIKFLFEYGADPYDRIAIDDAANIETLFLLVDKHSSRYPQGNKNIGGRTLALAIRPKDSIVFEKLIEKGLDMTMSLEADEEFEEFNGIGGISPFRYAIVQANQDGEFAFLELIFKAGYSPEVVVNSWRRRFAGSPTFPRVTAFLAAICTGNVSLVELFVRHGAKVNDFPSGTNLKRTPLQSAAEGGHIEIVQYLIKLGANINAPAARRGGGTAIQLAAIGGYLGILTILIENGADVDAAASKFDGNTALEAAARYGRTDTVALLLSAGAGKKGGDRAQFDKAIRYAREEGFEYICDMLTYFLEKRVVSSGPEVLDDLINWNPEEENVL